MTAIQTHARVLMSRLTAITYRCAHVRTASSHHGLHGVDAAALLTSRAKWQEVTLTCQNSALQGHHSVLCAYVCVCVCHILEIVSSYRVCTYVIWHLSRALSFGEKEKSLFQRFVYARISHRYMFSFECTTMYALAFCNSGSFIFLGLGKLVTNAAVTPDYSTTQQITKPANEVKGIMSTVCTMEHHGSDLGVSRRTTLVCRTWRGGASRLRKQQQLSEATSTCMLALNPCS